jgi:CRP-like cAMP-binding protein
MLSPLERLLHLKRVPLLSGLPATELAAVAEAATERLFEKGSVLFRAEDPAASMHVVTSGALAHFRNGRSVGLVGPGAGLGGLPLLARGAMGSMAVAERETLTLEVDADAVAEVLEDRFPILQHLLRELSRQGLVLLQELKVDPSRIYPEPRLPPLADGALDLVDRLLLLRAMTVFQRSSITALAELARTMASVSFAAGTVLWREGEPAPGMLVLLSGRVQALPSRGAPFEARPGFPLGALEAVAQVPRWYEARTLTPVTALSAQTDVLIDLFEDNFEMAMDYLAAVAAGILQVLQWRADEAPDEPGPDALHAQ